MADLQPLEGAPVDGTEVLYRRVTHTMADPVDGQANSSAFISNHADGVSTAVASLVSPAECLKGGKLGMGLVAVTAASARGLGVVVRRDHLDPTHVFLLLPGEGKTRRGVARALAAASVPVPGFFPFDPELDPA